MWYSKILINFFNQNRKAIQKLAKVLIIIFYLLIENLWFYFKWVFLKVHVHIFFNLNLEVAMYIFQFFQDN